MPQVIGIDHLYLTVSDLENAERFYDAVLLTVLEFKKNRFVLEGESHIQYYCRDFGLVLRPARASVPHQPYAPGLHHLCFRVETPEDVSAAATRLQALGLPATNAAHYPDYASDYYATFIEDPDGIRLEVTNYRQERRDRHDTWEAGPCPQQSSRESP